MNQKYQKICDLYHTEMDLMSLCSENINDEVLYSNMMECRQERLKLQGIECLSHIFEEVYGLANPDTIELLIEEAEEIGEQTSNHISMLQIYEHALEGCLALYGDSGEKTIECKLQIITIIKIMRDVHEEIPNRFDTEYTIALLESLFMNKHNHPLYGNYIPALLADEYLYTGNKQKGLSIYKTWSKTHSIENIEDEEVFNNWIEYANLLGELGYLRFSLECADKLYAFCMRDVLNHDMMPYFCRRISDIYLSCGYYKDGIEILNVVLKNEDTFSEECLMEFYNIRGQLAHLLFKNGEYGDAKKTITTLLEDLEREGIDHDSILHFENTAGNIDAKLIDYEGSYNRIKKIYEDARKRYGENDSYTILFEANLGNALLNLAEEVEGDKKNEYLSQAQYYLEDAYSRTIQPPITDVLFAMNIRQQLAELLMFKGDAINAITHMKVVYDDMKELLSEDNLETADIAERYATLVLEVQQAYDDVPEWISEIDPEPILQYCYEKKREYLGDKHEETLEVLYMYTRAVQSNVFIEALQNNLTVDLSRVWELHKRLLELLHFEIEQAVFIDSIEKQNVFVDLLDREAELFLWLMDFVNKDEVIEDAEQWYNRILPYKNILFDLLYMKKHGEEYQTINVEVLSARMKEKHGILIDIWQEVNAWIVFFVDAERIWAKIISPIPDEEIPDINDDDIPPQVQLDKIEYTIGERIEMAGIITEDIYNYLEGYKVIFLSLHKQLTQFPIATFLQKKIARPIVTIASASELLRDHMPQIVIEQVGVLDASKSIDRVMVTQSIKTNKCDLKTKECEALIISGHGFYDDDRMVPYDARNYIIVDDGIKITNKDIMSCDFRETRLIAIPICQTGNGAIYTNFGSFSIGSIFRIAGAKATIETLWDVRTSVSLAFEYEFFKLISEGNQIQTAFWKTIEILRHYRGSDLKKLSKLITEPKWKDVKYMLCTEGRKEHPFEDPFFWAGFVLIGD